MTEQEDKPKWLLELENRKRKPRLAHETGAGAPCLTCESACPGLDLHFWRKICKNCKCRGDEHDFDDDEFPQFELLFGPNVKNKKNRSVLLRVNDKKQVQVETPFEWVPPDTTKELAADYMKALPSEKLPIKGSAGAALRKQQLQKQLPRHDIDHKACDGLSENERKEFEKYLDNLKNCAGQGKVSKLTTIKPFDKSLMTPANASDMQRFSPQHSQLLSSGGGGSLNLRTPSSFIPKVSPPQIKSNLPNLPTDSKPLAPSIDVIRAQHLQATNEAFQPGQYHHTLENVSNSGKVAESTGVSGSYCPESQVISSNKQRSSPYDLQHSTNPNSIANEELVQRNAAHRASEPLNNKFLHGELKYSKIPGLIANEECFQHNLPHKADEIAKNLLPHTLNYSKATGNIANEECVQHNLPYKADEIAKNLLPHTLNYSKATGTIASGESLQNPAYRANELSANKSLPHEINHSKITGSIANEEYPQYNPVYKANEISKNKPAEYDVNHSKVTGSIASEESALHSLPQKASDLLKNKSLPYGLNHSKVPSSTVSGESNIGHKVNEPALNIQRVQAENNGNQLEQNLEFSSELPENALLAEQILSQALLPPSAINANDIVGSSLDEKGLSYIREKLSDKYSNKNDLQNQNVPRDIDSIIGHHSLMPTSEEVKRHPETSKELKNTSTNFNESHRNQVPSQSPYAAHSERVSAKLSTSLPVQSNVIHSEELNNPIFPEEPTGASVAYQNPENIDHLQQEMEGMKMNVTAVHQCHKCEEDIRCGDVVVTAEKIKDAVWHPGCFVCTACNELLVDLVYFTYKGNLYCARDLAVLLEIPRCFACDELIFVREYTVAEGHNYHVKHFCCWDCDIPLAGRQYISENDRPLCLPCYQKNYAKTCNACNKVIAADQEGVAIKNLNFHAIDECFCCYTCKKSLFGGQVAVKENRLLCSKECIAEFLHRRALGK